MIFKLANHHVLTVKFGPRYHCSTLIRVRVCRRKLIGIERYVGNVDEDTKGDAVGDIEKEVMRFALGIGDSGLVGMGVSVMLGFADGGNVGVKVGVIVVRGTVGQGDGTRVRQSKEWVLNVVWF